MFIATFILTLLVCVIAVGYCIVEICHIVKSQSPEVKGAASYFKVVFWTVMFIALLVINLWAAYTFRSQPWYRGLLHVIMAIFLTGSMYEVFDLVDHVVLKCSGNGHATFLRRFAKRYGLLS
jgi:hypothetical protein